jgi:SPP1 gp7 family putative phage head morphogenesis protein
MTPAEFAQLFRLTPKEAIAYLQARKLLTPTDDWYELWQDEHATQFTVSRLARADLLKTIQDAITRSVDGELSRRDWMRDITRALMNAGWWGENTTTGKDGEQRTTTFDAQRLKLIYDTNTRTAYAAGQWERIQRTKDAFPYLRYITMGDEKVRASHRALHNLVLPVDAPFWDYYLPPNGWRCRCRVVAVSQRDYERGMAPDGSKLKKAAPDVQMREWVDRRTGEIRQVPIGVDPGFGYNAGKAAARAAALADLIRSKTR